MDKTSIKTAASQTGVRPPPVPGGAAPLAAPAPQVQRAKPGPIKQFLSALASLRVTIVLFALGMILVFAGSLAQVDHGIVTVVAKYFRSFFVWIPFQIFFPRKLHVPGGFPFVGGTTLSIALMINLLAAHAVRFKLTWKRSGIIILHSGLIVLMLGEWVTGAFSVEAMMTVIEGRSSNYAESQHVDEFVFITQSPDNNKMENVVAVPGSMLRRGGTIRDARLPVDIVVDQYMHSSDIPEVMPANFKNPATAGDGLQRVAVEKSEVSGVDTQQTIDVPSAYVTFKSKTNGELLGTYLVSAYSAYYADAPQRLTVDGTTYDFALRFKRFYKPYSIHLHKFTHDRYDGTDIAKNYASLVQLEDPSRGENREVLIWMNHPLYYSGDTLYQADFLKGQQHGTVLQVVRNPGWTMPYIACGLVALGMLVHFGMTLVNFISKQVATTQNRRVGQLANGRRNGGLPNAPTSLDWNVIGVVSFTLVAAVLYLVVAMTPPAQPAGKFNFSDAGKIQVTDGGRSKPLDSVARNKLMIISGKQTTKDDSGEHSAMEWMLDVMTSRFSKSGKAESYKVFRIENGEVLGFLGLKEKPGSYRYSLNEMIANEDKFTDLLAMADRIEQMEPSKRNLFETKAYELARHLHIYFELSELRSPRMIDPTRPGEQSEPLRTALVRMQETGERNWQVDESTAILEAYSKNNVPAFNSTVANYRAEQTKLNPAKTSKAEFESFFNFFAPFYQCMVLYVIIVLVSSFSWLLFRKPLNRAAFWLTLLTWLVHTGAIISRMYISERPPITNLYTTAIFIGWAAVGILLIFEWFFKYSIATFLGGIIGFTTLVIAHYLSLDGDTMEMLVAVLDTNFWLATHVTAVNFGYGATLVAGFVGIFYIVASVYNNYTRSLESSLFTEVANYMLYGVICFAMFFSFTGTVLGGLWADFSWGRFWGWDPKENGALLIVIWNALILHARWAGIVKARGMSVLAVFGNIVTAWSWFGVNMLSVGLHNYGFMAGAVIWLILFDVSQLCVMVLGVIPVLHAWQWTPSGKDKFQAA